MIKLKAPTILSIAAVAFAASAHADIQTWRLTSTVYQVQQGFTPPAFLQEGSEFYIDYEINTAQALMPGSGGTGTSSGFGGFGGFGGFTGPVLSFTLNGITSAASGNISTGGGLNAINISPTFGRSDGIDFISFNNRAGTSQPDVISALRDFSTYATTASTDLRVDFGDKSVWAQPSSFVMTSVPELTTWWLMLLGAPAVLLSARRQRAS